jgi:4-amino-4-deoxy-L-arabinose transferase-like glycosyltransferase
MNIRLLAFLVVLTALRLVLIGRTELMPDEAQYHEWSQRLDWCYFSKGPAVALTIRAGTEMFGHGEFGVRFFAPILALATSLVLFALARRIYDERVATWAVVLANITPIFNAGGLLMTIDPLSIFFWTAALHSLWRALEKSPAFSLWWPLSGALIGCGFYAKWTNAMQLLSVLLLLLLTPRYRRELLRPGFYGMLATFVPFLLPIVRWQREHGWPTTMHLAARGGLETEWWRIDWVSFGKFFGGQFAVYSPFIFAAMLVALWIATRDSVRRWVAALCVRAIPALPGGLAAHWLAVLLVILAALAVYFTGNFLDDDRFHRAAFAIVGIGLVVGVYRCKEVANIHWKSRFLAAFALPLLLLYLWISLHHDAELNWTAPAAVSGFVLMVAVWHERVQAAPWRGLFRVAVSLSVMTTLAALFSDAVRAAGIPWPLAKDPSARMRGWRETAELVHSVRKDYEERFAQQLGDRRVFLIAENYGVAAALCYYLPEKPVESPGHPAVYVEESPVPQNQFHFWGRYDEYEERTGPVANEHEDSAEYGLNRFARRTALYITTREKELKPPSVLIRTFERWEEAGTFKLKQDGDHYRTVRIFICHRYKPGQLLD